MAEIYTYSASASGGHLSPDASDHINSVLSDLGLGGTTGDSSGTSQASVEPVSSSAGGSGATAGHIDTAAATSSPDHAGAILAGSEHDATAISAPAATAEPVAAPTTAGPSATYAAPTDAGTTSQAALPGADSLSGSHAASGADAFGGLGTDTLWGSDGGSHALGALPAAPAPGSDTIRSSGGMETIYGGNATIYASGHSTTLNTDTVHASGDGATMDGSASAQSLHTDAASSFAHLPGGSGSDTILLHDGSGGYTPVDGTDAHAASAYTAYDASGTATHDATYLGYGSPDSVVGGDGSDHFALAGYGATHDAYDDGTGTQDPYSTGGHVIHSDTGTYVSYHDGYDANYSGSDQLQFKDTVMAS